MVYGMQLNSAEQMASDLADEIKAFFLDKITSSFSITRATETP